jgi:nitrite reductase (NO-forming)
VPFVRTLLRRPPQGTPAPAGGAGPRRGRRPGCWPPGTAWFALAVVADLAALLGSDRVVDLDGRLGRLVPAVAVGFVLQTLTGALTYLLPAVWGRGAHGNRTLTRALEVGWPGWRLARLCCWSGAVLARRVAGDAHAQERP